MSALSFTPTGNLESPVNLMCEMQPFRLFNFQCSETWNKFQVLKIKRIKLKSCSKWKSCIQSSFTYLHCCSNSAGQILTPEFQAICFCVCAELRPVCLFVFVFFASGEVHRARRPFVSSTDHGCFFISIFCISLFKGKVCTVVLAFFGHINPAQATIITGSFSVAQQRSGSTPEPRFLAEGLFFVCRNRKNSKLGPDLELPQLKRGNSVLPYCFYVLISQ